MLPAVKCGIQMEMGWEHDLCNCCFKDPNKRDCKRHCLHKSKRLGAPGVEPGPSALNLASAR